MELNEGSCHLIQGFLTSEHRDIFYFINIVWKDDIKVLLKPGTDD